MEGEELFKIVVYKKGEEYHIILSGHAAKENMDILLPSEKEYRYAIKTYNMTNTASIWDECYVAIYE